MIAATASWRSSPASVSSYSTLTGDVIVVHAASIQDRDGAKLVLEKAHPSLPSLQRIWADGGYAGELILWVKDTYDWVLEIVKRTNGLKGFQVRPRRWVIERTLGWLGRYRRLSKDYECLPTSSEAMVHIAMIRLMLARLTKTQPSFSVLRGEASLVEVAA
jgi:putative transposase